MVSTDVFNDFFKAHRVKLVEKSPFEIIFPGAFQPQSAPLSEREVGLLKMPPIFHLMPAEYNGKLVLNS